MVSDLCKNLQLNLRFEEKIPQIDLQRINFETGPVAARNFQYHIKYEGGYKTVINFFKPKTIFYATLVSNISNCCYNRSHFWIRWCSSGCSFHR